MAIRLLTGDVRAMLATLPDASVQACITSPPYYTLRAYGTEPQVWGGDPDCDHTWQTERRYVKGGGGISSAEAFSEPGQANADRLKAARWKQDDTCRSCGAWRGELGQEKTLADFVAHLVEVFRAVKRVLHPTGVCMVNMGDSYNSGTQFNHHSNGLGHGVRYSEGDRGDWPGHRAKVPGLKQKDLMMVPSRLAIALQDDGWYLRSMMPWVKRSAMPESATDRPTSAVEYVFMLTRSPRSFWDHVAVRRDSSPSAIARNGLVKTPSPKEQQRQMAGFQPGLSGDYGTGRNMRNSDPFYDSLGLVLDGDGLPMALDVNPTPLKMAHFASFPPKLVDPLIRGATSEKGCCPACGAPWQRVVEREKAPPDVFTNRNAPTDELTYSGSRVDGVMRGHGQKLQNWLEAHPPQTVGWQPSCQCDETKCVSCGFVLELPHGEQETSTKHQMSGMRGDVPPVETSAGLLQSGLLSRASTDPAGSDVRTLRQDVPSEEPPGSVLRQVLLEQMDGAAAPECARLVQDEQGIHSGLSAGSSAGDEAGLHHGASPRHGGDDRSPASSDGDRPPPERPEGRQPAGEPGTRSVCQRPRQTEEADLHGDVPLLRDDLPGEGECPRCRGRLESSPLTPQPTTVLDCFGGSGTVGVVADRLGRDAILIDLNETYVQMAKDRITGDAPLFADVSVELA